ncbi:MAG: hypothetical protein HN742_14880 [Lentisphaerae bacterium]|jgi:predicted DNA-binding protein|nr:hypothetical protein [Lentisphaerota bacterium]MBT4822001.1 hypothetical protein [Lentisphaerota bacterium]MBT5609547.1 hypothetical protein [Lentisphaerota bacterium]MBT7058453.1 hypothetical protein [Lentisphaerota bacterium]MBT7843162.1 hypothetical protein [Lentisphaerota bacterium]
MLSIKLPASLEERLAELSEAFQIPEGRIVKEAITEYLEELESYLAAKKALANVRVEEHIIGPAREFYAEYLEEMESYLAAKKALANVRAEQHIFRPAREFWDELWYNSGLSDLVEGENGQAHGSF